MKSALPRWPALLLVALTLAAAGSTLAASAPFHFALTKSLPADKATVHQVPEVKLWFTEAPTQGTVAIRLIDAKGEAVSTTDPVQDPEDASAFSVRVPERLPAGSYTVSWRGMGDDGHVVRGDFAFTVAGH